MRDWLICVHVALDKCNVSHRAIGNNCYPPRAHISEQNGSFKLASLKMFFQVYLKTTESKRNEKCAAGNIKCCGNHLSRLLSLDFAGVTIKHKQKLIKTKDKTKKCSEMCDISTNISTKLQAYMLM